MSKTAANIITNLIESFGDYFKIDLGDFYISSAHRWLVYSITFIFVGLCTFAALAAYEGINPVLNIPLSFKGMYAWHTAINFALTLAIIDILSSLLLKPWGTYDKRNVGKVWIALVVTYLLSCMFQRTLIYQLVSLYAPAILWIHEMNPSQRPGIIISSAFILPFWLAIGYVVIRIILNKQAQAQELFRVRIDTLLEDRQRPSPPINAEATMPNNDNGYIPLPAGAGVEPIPTRQVSHVTVEDHYLRIYYQNAEGPKNVLIRMALKELSACISEDQFIQVHRSHIVNLEHISRLQRSGRKVRVVMKRGEIELPVSRYRFSQILPKIEKYLHPPPPTHTGKVED